MSDLRCKKIWCNGGFVDWDQATVHVMTHALHYGSSWFEGIRCYKTARGTEVFRLAEHVSRLFDSCKIYRAEIPYSQREFCEAIQETVRVNGFEKCYIRPLVFRGQGSIGVNPLSAPIQCYIIVWDWGSYLGEDALEQGVDVCISSWVRAAANTFPTMAKAGGNYLNSALIKMEAVTRGFAEGIALDTDGFVSEGSGENIFAVRHQKIFTPPLSCAILPGITRHTVMTLAKECGLTLVEERIPREMLYLADEVFLTGTAAEITPVRSIDGIQIGSGKRGPVAAEIQRVFFNYVRGDVEDRHGWMTRVYEAKTV